MRARAEAVLRDNERRLAAELSRSRLPQRLSTRLTSEQAPEALYEQILGSFVSKLMRETDLSDQEIADIMGWSPFEVARIRKRHVDQRATVVAIGQRIARGVNRNPKPA